MALLRSPFLVIAISVAAIVYFNGKRVETYTPEVKKNFISGCVKSDPSPNASAVCNCAYDRISKTVAYKDFKAADSAMRSDPSTPPPAWLVQSVLACVGR